MKSLLIALTLLASQTMASSIWLDPQDPGVDEVLNVEDNQMAFYNGPEGQVEWLLNRGRSTAIRIKGYDDPAILKWDLSAYQGMTVLDAELHLTLHGSSTVNALCVSTINNDWFEGNQYGGTAQEGDSCWRWRSYPADPNDPQPEDEWAFPGSDFSTASFGNFGTLTSFGYKWSDTFKHYTFGSYTRVAMKLDPDVVHAMINDQYGLTVTDPRWDFGSGNPRIYSEDQNATVQPRLYIQAVLDDFTPPDDPTSVYAARGERNGELILRFTAPSDLEDGTAFGYTVRYSTTQDFATATDVDRWRIPRPAGPGTEQRLLIEYLNPGTKYYCWVQAYDKAGNAGTAVMTSFVPPHHAEPSLADAAFPQPDPTGKDILGVPGALNYWACSGLAKVDPETGHRLEDTRAPGNHATRAVDDYKKANPVWDSALNRITLLSGRNEMLGFQLILERLTGSLTDITVSLSDLTGPGSSVVESATSFEAYKLHYVQDNGQYFPDAAIPLSSPFATTFSLPDAATNPSGVAQGVWCDLYIPKQIPPGAYSGTLTFDCNEIATPVQIEIEVQVQTPVLPDSLSFYVDLNGYGNKWSSEASRFQVFQLCHKHRMVPNTLPYGWNEYYGSDRAPDLTGAGPTRAVSDWSTFTNNYGPFFDGTGFSPDHPQYPYHGPGQNTPIADFYTTFYEGWPNTLTDPTWGYDAIPGGMGWSYWNDKFDAGGSERQEFFLDAPDVFQAFPEGYATGYRNVAQEFAQYVQDMGWHETAFQMYLNNKGTYNPCIALWTLEEQYVAEDFRADAWFFSLCKDGVDAANAPDVKWHWRIDTSTRWSQNWGELRGICNLRCQGDGKHWNYRHDRYRGYTETMEEHRWWYGGGAPVTDTLVAHTSEFLKHWSHGFNGGLPYWDSYRTDWTNADTLAVLPSGDSVPGHGYFDGRIATIRMKGMRFAIQLCEYLNRMAGYPGWNPSLVRSALSDRYGDHSGMGYDAFGGDEYEGLDIQSCHELHADLLKTLSGAKQRMKPDNSHVPLPGKK